MEASATIELLKQYQDEILKEMRKTAPGAKAGDVGVSVYMNEVTLTIKVKLW